MSRRAIAWSRERDAAKRAVVKDAAMVANSVLAKPKQIAEARLRRTPLGERVARVVELNSHV